MSFPEVKSNHSLDDYARYIAYERRARNPDLFVMVNVFERAIAEAEKRRFDGELGAEEALRTFWVGLADVLVSTDAISFCSIVTLSSESTIRAKRVN